MLAVPFPSPLLSPSAKQRTRRRLCLTRRLCDPQSFCPLPTSAASEWVPSSSLSTHTNVCRGVSCPGHCPRDFGQFPSLLGLGYLQHGDNDASPRTVQLFPRVGGCAGHRETRLLPGARSPENPDNVTEGGPKYSVQPTSSLARTWVFSMTVCTASCPWSGHPLHD